ncbi:class I SAM-dependent methyltransferase [Neisseria animalis]|uniref:Methyltransferase n=1 Tax=Neisseria animalis TaxID=492 RepID=A0A5P3MP73_NEIAN|nr:methyltransferase domain-containing protein [Neisseria animalis]QEY23332.1 methyltransferase [Neisseria animalis]ROW33181.1 methyltransferase [Neisseria animalis]VEE08700.1 putative methyltransferase [Neisseria animalis]
MQWFEYTAAGRYAAEKEKAFFDSHVPQKKQLAVQLGARWLRPSEQIIYVPEDVEMAVCATAWADRSLDMLLMPHTHEYAGCPLLALAEAARVLKVGGRLVLTGFNPHSLWYFSRWFDGKRLPRREHCLSLSELKQHAEALGFSIEYGKFMVYVPAAGSLSALRFWQFLEKAGDRWWPQCAAVYGLVLVKQAAGVHLLPECETQMEEVLVLGAARVPD